MQRIGAPWKPGFRQEGHRQVSDKSGSLAGAVSSPIDTRRKMRGQVAVICFTFFFDTRTQKN